MTLFYLPSDPPTLLMVLLIIKVIHLVSSFALMEDPLWILREGLIFLEPLQMVLDDMPHIRQNGDTSLEQHLHLIIKIRIRLRYLPSFRHCEIRAMLTKSVIEHVGEQMSRGIESSSMEILFCQVHV